MSYTLEQFAADCHEALAADSGQTGREKVLSYVKKAINDEAFVAEHLPRNDLTLFVAVRRHFLFEGSEILAQTFYDVMKLIMCLINDVHDGVKGAFQLALCRV